MKYAIVAFVFLGILVFAALPCLRQRHDGYTVISDDYGW